MMPFAKPFKMLLKPLLLVVLLATVAYATPQQHIAAQTGGDTPDTQTIVQVSTYDYFAAGNLDGFMPISELHRYGDFGLGTFDKLNGEMVEVNGKIYQVPISGIPQLADESVKTPFAVVTYFAQVKPVPISVGMTMQDLEKQIEQVSPNQNMFLVIRLEGNFIKLKLRSVPPQAKPYPTLADAIKQQTVFDLTNVAGTRVGVRSPAFAKGLNIVGYHFHFLGSDQKTGGHVLDLTTGEGQLQINEKPVWKLYLPNQ